MTRRPHLKSRVRARMARTGERYAVARDRVLATAGNATGPADGRTVLGARHFAGVHAESTALRILATHANVRLPGGEPLSESLAFMIGGGIGIGVFAFVYEKDDVASFFIGGGHRWDDARAFLAEAAARLGLDASVVETGGARRALAQLVAATASGPAAAWADLAELGTRGLPAEWSGSGYHVLVVYGRDSATGHWLVGDLARDPVAIAPDVLARARARIATQRHRLLTVSASGRPADPATAVRAGLRATVDGFRKPRARNFGLDALTDWAARLEGTGRDAWSRAFPRGRRLFAGLTAIHRFVECYGTGGGLLRPLFARGLDEAARLTGDERLLALGRRYAELGAAWSELARAALPNDVPILREARELEVANMQRYLAHGPGALEAIRAAGERLVAIGDSVSSDFPLSDAEAADLRAALAARARAIHAGERAALDELEAIVHDAA